MNGHQQFYNFRPPRTSFHVTAKTANAKIFQEKFGQVFVVPEFTKGPEPKLTIVTPHGVSMEVQKKENGDIYVNDELLFEGGW